MMESLGQMVVDKLKEWSGEETDMKKKKKTAEENLKGRETNSGNMSVRDQLKALQEEENARRK